MTHQVFISYCHEDSAVADAICRGLEAAGVGCWMAPRNVRPGENWGRAIVKAIGGSKVMVLVFSAHTNDSRHVNNEIERAVSHRVTIIPFRIERVPPSEDLELFISSCHWLDAVESPIEGKIAELADAVRAVIGVEEEAGHLEPAPTQLATIIAEAGPNFHHYVVQRDAEGRPIELGRGAMGVTYRAMDSRLRRTVALKVVSTELLATEAARQRFIHEAQATAALQHPNIAPIYYLGEQDGSCFYAMEFIDGPTLETMIREGGPLPPGEALAVCSQAAAALGLAHEAGIVHQDVKPSNIMVVRKPDGSLSVRVIDFGLAAAAGGEAERGDHFEGTPLFASPEQLDHIAPDARSDVYSLGATLYFALAGRPPFEGTYSQIASQQIMQAFPEAPLAHVPPAVVALVRRLMDPDAACRPQNGGEARSEIEVVLRDFREAGAQTAMEWMATRFESIHRVGAIDGGTLYRVETGARQLAVMAFDTSARGLAVADQVRATAPLLRGLSSPSVRRVEEMAEMKDGMVLVTEWLGGTRLLSVLRVRRVLPGAEARLILSSIAAALDEAAAVGLPLPHLGLREILLQPQQKPETPLSQWPGLRPVIDFLPVGESRDEDVRTTIVSNSAMAQVTQFEASTHGPAALIASLAYEILGGMSAPGIGPYVPLAELSQAGNAALRGIFGDPATAIRATELVETILPAGEVSAGVSGPQHRKRTAAPSQRIPAAPRQEGSATSAAPASARSRGLVIAGAASAALLVVGLGVWILSGKSSATPEPVAANAIPPPRPSPSPESDMLRRAKEKESAQDFVAALALYAEMLRAEPGSAEIRQRAANALARLEENPAAIDTEAGKATLRRLAELRVDRASAFLGGLLRTESPVESLKFFKDAAELGDRRAMVAAGLMIASGQGVPRADYHEAARWFKRASDLGEVEGMRLYADCLLDGLGTEVNEAEAARLYSSSMSLGDVPAKSRLADMYRKGRGVPQADLAKAFSLFQEAAKDGFLEAQGNLGVMYMNGESVPPDPAKAVALWKDGAEKNDEICMVFYAMALEGGAVGASDPEEAQKWYKKAAKLGNPKAVDWCVQNSVDF